MNLIKQPMIFHIENIYQIYDERATNGRPYKTNFHII